MNCKPEQLNAYAAGALSESGRAAVEEHLRGCAACRAELDGLRELAGSLEQAFDKDRTVLLWTKARLKRRERRGRLAIVGLAAAAMLAIASSR